MGIDFLNEINDRYQIAISFHKENADLFWFLYLPGFAMLHEYQHLCEILTQRKLKRYITSTYNKVMSDKISSNANIIEPLTKGKNRNEFDSNERWLAIKNSFKAYQAWEENTLIFYQNNASKLLKIGEISAFNFVSEIIKEVKAELVFINDNIIEMSGHNWDIAQITETQADWFERYEYLIKNLFGKSEMFHHWNGAYDASSRIFFEKTPE